MRGSNNEAFMGFQDIGITGFSDHIEGPRTMRGGSIAGKSFQAFRKQMKEESKAKDDDALDEERCQQDNTQEESSDGVIELGKSEYL